MATDANVAHMLANAERARSMANAACSPKYKRMLAEVAADYERLARCRLIILDTQRRWLTRSGCWTAIDNPAWHWSA